MRTFGKKIGDAYPGFEHAATEACMRGANSGISAVGIGF
jgi:hypothetical protein